MKRTPLRTRSKKREARDRIFVQTRDAVFARDGGCRFDAVLRAASLVAPGETFRDDCAGGLHAHHVTRRSQGGTDTLNNLITLCAAHHRWVHDNPALAREIGLLA